jgi:hypothetical protein
VTAARRGDKMSDDLAAILGPRAGGEVESAVEGLDSTLLRLLEAIAADTPWAEERCCEIRGLVWRLASEWGLPDACIPGDASFPVRVLLEDERIVRLARTCAVHLAPDDEARWDAEESWDVASDAKDRTLAEMAARHWPERERQP